MTTSQIDDAALLQQFKDAGIDLSQVIQPDPTQDPMQPQQVAAPPPLPEVEQLKGELKALKNMVGQFQANTPQFRPVEDDRPTPQTPAQVLQQRIYDAKRFAADAETDIGRATAEALATHLGLPPGMDVKNLFQAVLTAQQTSALELKKLQEQRAADRYEFEGQLFMQTHEDYKPSQENSKVLMEYIGQYGLEPTRNNLHLVYTQAVADGKIKPEKLRRSEQQDDFQQAAPPKQRPQQLPSLRQGQTVVNEPDVDKIISHLQTIKDPSAQQRYYEGVVSALSR